MCKYPYRPRSISFNIPTSTARSVQLNLAALLSLPPEGYRVHVIAEAAGVDEQGRLRAKLKE